MYINTFNTVLLYYIIYTPYVDRLQNKFDIITNFEQLLKL